MEWPAPATAPKMAFKPGTTLAPESLPSPRKSTSKQLCKEQTASGVGCLTRPCGNDAVNRECTGGGRAGWSDVGASFPSFAHKGAGEHAVFNVMHGPWASARFKTGVGFQGQTARLPEVETLGGQRCFVFLRFYLFIFREGRRRRKTGRNINVGLPVVRPLQVTWPETQACALDWESNQQSPGSKASAQSTEPHQPGPKMLLIG